MESPKVSVHPPGTACTESHCTLQFTLLFPSCRSNGHRLAFQRAKLKAQTVAVGSESAASLLKIKCFQLFTVRIFITGVWVLIKLSQVAFRQVRPLIPSLREAVSPQTPKVWPSSSNNWLGDCARLLLVASGIMVRATNDPKEISAVAVRLTTRSSIETCRLLYVNISPED